MRNRLNKQTCVRTKQRTMQGTHKFTASSLFSDCFFLLSNRRHKERTFFFTSEKNLIVEKKRSFLVSRPPPLPKPLFTSFKLPNLLKNNSNFFPLINFFNPCHFLLKVNIIERNLRRSLHYVNKIILKPPPSPSFFFSLSFSVLFLSTLFISFLN